MRCCTYSGRGPLQKDPRAAAVCVMLAASRCKVQLLEQPQSAASTSAARLASVKQKQEGWQQLHLIQASVCEMHLGEQSCAAIVYVI